MLQQLAQHQNRLKACNRCPGMTGPAVHGEPALSKILLLGQAPGDKEPKLGRPFAWTAGKTLFKWFQSIGLDETTFRRQVYMAAVCRCFPGKNPKGGDRLPNQAEITRCRAWLDAEFALLQPDLLIPVGKLAVTQFVRIKKLSEVVGQQIPVHVHGRYLDMVALPHPSGLSTWHHMPPGKQLLQNSLALIQQHPAWQQLVSQ